MTASEQWRRPTACGDTVPIRMIEVPPDMRAHGVVLAREVIVDRATMVVALWDDGMTTVGSFCGGGGPDVARAKALQRAFEQGLRLKARWAGQRSEVGNVAGA